MSSHRFASRVIGVSAALILVGALFSTPASASPSSSKASAGPALEAAAPEVGAAETAVGWRQVDAGMNHTCGIRTDGRLYCWGNDGDGQLGNGGANADRSTPVQVAGQRTDWATVSAGSAHTCARRTSGRLFCWGADGFGQLGDGGTASGQPVPVQVGGDRTDWATVTAGNAHTCARRTTGRLYCWGWNFAGQVGDGDTADRPFPVQVAGGRTDWAAVTAGSLHTCARRTTGHLYCWGNGGYGQLGNGGVVTAQPTPVPVAGDRYDWATVTAGSAHTCARRTDRRLYCWGYGSFGQLGDGDETGAQPLPVEVADARTDWATATGGGEHTCARRTSGRLFCWGADSYGQLGDGGIDTDRPTPVTVVL